MSSTLQALCQFVDASKCTSWDITALQLHASLLDRGFITCSCKGDTKDDEKGTFVISADGKSLGRAVLHADEWKGQDGSYTFHYLFPVGRDHPYGLVTAIAFGHLDVKCQETTPDGELKVDLSWQTTRHSPIGPSGEGSPSVMTDRQHKSLSYVVPKSAKLESLEESTSKQSELTQNLYTSIGCLTAGGRFQRGFGMGGPGGMGRGAEPFFPSPWQGHFPPSDRRAPRSDLDPFAGCRIDPISGLVHPRGLFRPDGNLIGPNHPDFGRTRPQRPPGSRFDDIDPFGRTGEPTPDHERVPGGPNFGFPPIM